MDNGVTEKERRQNPRFWEEAAVRALQGLVTRDRLIPNDGTYITNRAADIADAMLAERNKRMNRLMRGG